MCHLLTFLQSIVAIPAVSFFSMAIVEAVAVFFSHLFFSFNWPPELNMSFIFYGTNLRLHAPHSFELICISRLPAKLIALLFRIHNTPLPIFNRFLSIQSIIKLDIIDRPTDIPAPLIPASSCESLVWWWLCCGSVFISFFRKLLCCRKHRVVIACCYCGCISNNIKSLPHHNSCRKAPI